MASSTPLLDKQGSNVSRASLAKQPSYRNKGGDDDEGSRTIELVFKVLVILLTIISFAPLVLGLLIPDKRVAATVATVTALFGNAFGYALYRLGRTVSWPKPLDIITLVIFLVETIWLWAYPESNDFWQAWFMSVLGFAQAAGVAFSWFVLGVPLARPFVEDQYGRVGATHPFCRFAVRIASGVYFAAFVALGVLGLPLGLAWAAGRDRATAALVATIGTYVVLAVAYVLSFPALSWYMEKNEQKIFEKYEDEVMEWMERYPDEELTKLALEKAEATEQPGA